MPEKKPDVYKDALLQDWKRLNVRLMEMPEKDVEDLLNYEKEHRARLRVMLRLYHRMSKLRGAREKKELGAMARG